jgi:hypothetical protein
MSYQLSSVDSNERAELFAEPRDQQARPRFRGVLVTGVALLVMGIFAGGLWFAYVQGLRHAGGGGDVPLIRADERPTKGKPEKPGGMEIPDRDKLNIVYTQKRAGVEHLLPPPEKPMPRPTASPASAAQPEAPQPPPTSAAAPAATVATTTALQQPAPKSSLKAAAAAPATAQLLPAKAGGTRIQLGSVRSEDAARQEWDRIRRTNSDLLGSLSATPIRADLGDKRVFYRIQTDPIADAARICRELKQRNIGCIIAR